MAEIRISLPILFPAQESIADSKARFTIVAGGQFSGKSTSALDVALMSPMGALHGFAVLLCLPDDDAVLKAKRRIAQMVQPLVVGRADRPRLELSTGGSILFVAMDAKDLQLWDQVALVVVDDAQLMPRIYDSWLDVLKPMLARARGRAWIFGKPAGTRNGFFKLFALADEDPDYAGIHLPTSANPHYPADKLKADAEAMSDDVYLQERGGQFVEAPIELSVSQTIIGRDETFRQWCERLARDGLLVDNKPFTMEDRPAMWYLYDQIPSTIEEAYERVIVLMKCTQIGFTVMEIMAMIYLSLKFMPATIGMYLPNRDLAAIKSSDRFMPILRTIPAAYALLTGEDEATGTKGKGEGNVLRRNIGSSKFYFLWTSGKGATESVPMDVISLDEVQEMRIADIEKVGERMSASRIRFTLAGSTANMPDEDIHWLYKRGTMHAFHTECPHCGAANVLDDYFPECIGFNPDAVASSGLKGDYQYVCKECKGWIEDPQRGEWRARAGRWDPERKRWFDERGNLMPESAHYPQMLSSTISARQIMLKYFNAEDMKNFFNRVLGKPYVDPSQVPVNLEMLNECAKIGQQLGVAWKARAANTFMGIDQMGAFNVALIAERLPTGHQAIIHAEMIYSSDPFARCDELMALYGVQVCCVETLPNYNDAKRFANRWPGKVFLAGYAELRESMLLWGDAVPSKQERKTDEADQDRYTVTLDQYKCMQVAMKRIQERVTVFADPDELVAEVMSDGIRGEKQLKKVLRDIVFFHFTRTALVAIKDEEQHKYKRKVVKVGIDPHFSYAYMLLNVAWARAHGTTAFLFPDEAETPELVEKPGAVTDARVIAIVREQTAMIGLETCGSCANQLGGFCSERFVNVKDADPACDFHVPAD
jgi:hypothetical protein